MSLDNETLSADDTNSLAGTSQEQEPIEVMKTDEPAEDFEAQLAMKNLEKRRAAKKRKRRLRIIAICALVAGIAAVIWGFGMNRSDEEEEEYVPETAIVERGDFSNEITASGTLRAGSTEVVTPEVDGIIESVLVAEGDTVSKGDVLFTIKNDELDRAIRDAEQEITTAQQSVASAQSAVTQAVEARDDAWTKYYEAWGIADTAHREWANLKKNYSKLHATWEKRYKAAQKLRVPEPTVEPVAPEAPDTTGMDPADAADVLSQYNKDFSAYQTAYTQYLSDAAAYRKYQEALAKAGEEPEPAGEEPEYPEEPSDAELQGLIQDAEEGVSSAVQTLEKAQESYDDAVKAGENRTVKAPSSGDIVSMTAKVGASTLGSGTEGMGGDALVQISDMRKMAVDVEVNEIDIMSIKKGQKAVVTFSALPDIEAEAVVKEVSSVASGEGGEMGGGGSIVTFRVGLVIDKPDKQLRAGMTANVNIITADATDVLLIPTSAVSEGAEGYSVEVVLDEETMETETRQIKLGERGDSEVVVTEGLSEGEVILLSGGMDELYEEEEF